MKPSSIGALVIVAIVIGSLLNLVALCVQTRSIASVPFSATPTIYEKTFSEFKKQKLTLSKPIQLLQETESKLFVWKKNRLHIVNCGINTCHPEEASQQPKDPSTFTNSRDSSLRANSAQNDSGEFRDSQLQEIKSSSYSSTKLNSNHFISSNESVNIQNGILTIAVNKKTLWSSNEAWWVDSYSIADVDGDGKNDLALSVWKSGNFGSSKPFWIKENDPAVKNHFFVFSFKNNRVVPLWQSSNLAVPNCEFLLSDLDDDKIMELVVLEGTYNENQECKPSYLAVWQWNGWGFSNEYRSEVGMFKDLELMEQNGRKMVGVKTRK